MEILISYIKLNDEYKKIIFGKFNEHYTPMPHNIEYLRFYRFI